jgi:hypothetical protein
MDGRSTSSHDSEKFRTRSMEKQGGMAFGFRKAATAVIEPDISIYIYIYPNCFPKRLIPNGSRGPFFLRTKI